ncbi:MAG: choice-of-anchor D domain-containing protein, partial [Planctomycetota bacterium]
STTGAFATITDNDSGSFTAEYNPTNVTLTYHLSPDAFPEINIKGNGVSIADDNTTPSAADDTHFGNALITGGTVSHTFTIENTGTASLNLSGSPKVSIGGANPTDFTVTLQPGSPVGIGGTATFTLEFNPSATGLRSAEVSIANDDFYENPYNFSIQGNGVTPEINLQGNGTDIASGDASPSLADDTDFGSVCVTAGSAAHVFTLQNTGTGSLEISDVSSSDGQFEVSGITTPVIVAAGGSTTFTLTFDPTAGGSQSATISISSTDDDEDPYTFAVQGEGIPVDGALAGTATICPGGSANLTVSITGGTAPYSVVYNPGGVVVGNYSSGSNISVSPAATTTFVLVSVTDANGCESFSATGSAVVTVEDVTLPVALCQN